MHDGQTCLAVSTAVPASDAVVLLRPERLSVEVGLVLSIDPDRLGRLPELVRGGQIHRRAGGDDAHAQAPRPLGHGVVRGLCDLADYAEVFDRQAHGKPSGYSWRLISPSLSTA